MDTRVFSAAQNGDKDEIGRLQGSNRELMREVTFEKNNILHIAAREGHSEFVEWILQHVQGSSGMCLALNSDWNIPLHEAAHSGDAHLVSILIQSTKAARDHNTIRGSSKRIIQRFKMLCGLNDGIGDANIFGETPLLIACKYGHHDAVSGYLMEASTPINFLLGKYQPCLHLAAYGGHLGVVKLLLNNRYWRDALFYSDAQGANPLHTAISGGHMDVVREILIALSSDERKVVMTKKDGDGRCPIHLAVVRGRYNIINELLSSIPDCIEIRSADRKTVLHFAVAYNRFELVKKLLFNTKSQKIRKLVSYDHDIFGNNTLHLAAHNAVDPQLMKYLLSSPGVDVNSVNNEGFTPLDIAVGASSKKPTDEIIRILKEHGAYAKKKRGKDNNAMNMDTLVASLIATDICSHLSSAWWR